MSNLFGIGPPKIIGTGTPDMSTRILYHSILDPKFSEKVYKIFESPVSSSGKRTYKSKGRYATFNVMVNLYKYDDDITLPSAAVFANTLLSYENNDVRFFPFSTTGNEIKNAAGNSVHCRLIDLNFDFHKKVGNTYDFVTLTFLTNEFWDISALLPVAEI